MNQFIEKNRKMLKAYCLVARIIGWALILGGFVWFLSVVAGPSSVVVNATDGEAEIATILYAASSLVFDFFFPGLVAFGIAAFIECLLQTEYKPGLMLRNARAFLFAYAFFLIGAVSFKSTYCVLLLEGFSYSHLLFIQSLLLPPTAKVLVLIGLGQILKRILPIIEESKTLV